MRRIKDINHADRPREKLLTKGPASLSDFELLQALVGSGNKQAYVSVIAENIKKVLQKYGANVTYEQLEQILGLGKAKTTEIIAAFELSKRYLVESEQPILDSLEKVVAELADIRNKKQEYFICITLDGANRKIAKRIISIGTLNASLVHPREVFSDAITDRAASIIVAHNHPSDSLTPSKVDLELTHRLTEAAKLIGINLLDHVIMTKTGAKSVIMPIL